MADAREDRVSVRLDPNDREALDYLTQRVRERMGAGIRVEASDAVRWAIHTCANLIAEEDGVKA